jgi:iron complex transport system substrate-binding protein
MKQLLSILLALALILSLTACGATPPETSDAQASGEESVSSRQFTDDCGRTVTLPDTIRRVVATGPMAQILLYSIAPDMLVGLAAKWYDCAKGIVPQEYFDLPYFGQLYNTANLNIEELALADPQVIIDIGQTMSTGTEDMESLQAQTGIPTVFIASSPDSIPETFRRLGQLLGREERAEELAAFCERVESRTEAIMEQVGDRKVRAIYVLGPDGLNVLANNSYHSELMDILTNNIALVDTPSAKGSGSEVTLEQIALWNPDLILFSPNSIYDEAPRLDTWKELTAIATGNYLKVPEGPYNWMGTPPACQRYLGMIWLTAQLYPAYCDYDVKAEIMEFYALFYNCQLTQEQYAQLTAGAFLEE